MEHDLKELHADCKEAAADLTMIMKYVQEKYPWATFTVSVEHRGNEHPIITIEGEVREGGENKTLPKDTLIGIPKPY